VGERKRILDAEGVAGRIGELAEAIVARGDDTADLAVIGIRRRGVPIAERVAARIGELTGRPPRSGALDITLYRDDLSLVADQPVVHATEIEFPVDGLRCVLVDDVLFTGRTIRAAMEALFALGRPGRVELAVLVDRGHRELPIQADYAARTLDTSASEIVDVRVEEIDGEDGVEVTTGDGERA